MKYYYTCSQNFIPATPEEANARIVLELKNELVCFETGLRDSSTLSSHSVRRFRWLSEARDDLRASTGRNVIVGPKGYRRGWGIIVAQWDSM